MEAVPGPQAVLDALDDLNCGYSEGDRRPALGGYWESDPLCEASLLRALTGVRLSLAADREPAVGVSRPARSADERLANLWPGLRKET